MKNNYTELENHVGGGKDTLTSPNFGLLSFGSPSHDGLRTVNPGHSRVASYSTKDASSLQPSAYSKPRQKSVAKSGRAGTGNASFLNQ